MFNRFQALGICVDVQILDDRLKEMEDSRRSSLYSNEETARREWLLNL